MAKTVYYHLRPAKKFMVATGNCVQQATIYGECILQSYTEMSKQQCDKEFQLFKICVSKHLK